MNGAQAAGGILLFALATAVLYVWGLRKSAMQGQDLKKRLQNKCAGMIVKELKKRGTLTEQQVTALVSGVKKGEFWSKQRAVVTQPESFAADLLAMMQDQRMIEQTEAGYRLK